MLDWWTVRGERWGVRNWDFKVEVHPCSMGAGDMDASYSEADYEYFDRGLWCFTEVIVTPVDRDLNDMTGVRQSIRGVPWGDLEKEAFDRDDVSDAQARDLALDACRELLRTGLTVEAEQDSPFRRLEAPF